MAIEEAFLAEQGFMDGQLGISKDTSYDANLNGFSQAAGSNQAQECPQDQACVWQPSLLHIVSFFIFVYHSIGTYV